MNADDLMERADKITEAFWCDLSREPGSGVWFWYSLRSHVWTKGPTFKDALEALVIERETLERATR